MHQAKKDTDKTRLTFYVNRERVLHMYTEKTIRHLLTITYATTMLKSI